MKTSMTLAALAALALLAGCASRPTPVPVIAPSSDLSALVGEWSGEYTSAETGRIGSIAFTLQAGKDTAAGSVVMVPRVTNEPVTPGMGVNQSVTRNTRAQAAGEVLTIRFVRMEGGQVVGTLDPYRDPDCGCQLTTTFRGAFTDSGTIKGTFISTGSSLGHIPSKGSWTVTRSAK